MFSIRNVAEYSDPTSYTTIPSTNTDGYAPQRFCLPKIKAAAANSGYLNILDEECLPDASRKIYYTSPLSPTFSHPVTFSDFMDESPAHAIARAQFRNAPKTVVFDILSSPTTTELKKRVSNYSAFANVSWDSDRLMIISNIWNAVFQDPAMKNYLDATGRAYLNYRSDDPILGDGPDGKGQNQLGQCLMRIRSNYSDSIKPPEGMNTASWLSLLSFA